MTQPSEVIELLCSKFRLCNWFVNVLGIGNASVDTSIQNGGVHNNTQISSQAQSATKNNQRKSLDKGEKQEDQHNKHNAEKSSQSEKNDKKYAHTNGTTVSSNDLQFIERVR